MEPEFLDMHSENIRGNEKKLQMSKFLIITRAKSHHEQGQILEEDSKTGCKIFNSGDMNI